MTYEKAEDMAPPFRLGMKPLVDSDGLCSGTDPTTKMPKICPKSYISDMDDCQPNDKACVRAIENDAVGYAQGAVTRMYDDANQGTYVETGPVQRAQVKFTDVGEIVEVQLEEDVSWDGSNQCYSLAGATKRGCSSAWSPAFMKISTNDPKTGIGNGVFYVKPREDLRVGTIGVKGDGDNLVDQTESLIAKVAAPTASGLPDDGSFNAIVEKCIAQTCEEEMDTKLGLSSMKTEFGEMYETLEG